MLELLPCPPLTSLQPIASLRTPPGRLVNEYTASHADDLFRIWETERPFELHLLGFVTISGRADVILDREGECRPALAILDYKTSTSRDVQAASLQLQVYAGSRPTPRGPRRRGRLR